MISVKKHLISPKLNGCMELFGFDFIIDKLYNVWMVEVIENCSVFSKHGFWMADEMI